MNLVEQVVAAILDALALFTGNPLVEELAKDLPNIVRAMLTALDAGNDPKAAAIAALKGADAAADIAEDLKFGKKGL